MDPNTHLVLASSIIDLEGERAIVLLAGQPERCHPDRYVLEATIVPERSLGQGLCLVARWKGGRQTARVNRAGQARLQGIPAGVVEAVQGGDPQAFLLEIERAGE